MRWLDITTCYSWNRPPVGIVRVELEAIMFALTLKNTKFCIFDKATSKFYEIPRNDTKKLYKKLSSIRFVNINTERQSRFYHKFVSLIRILIYYIFRDRDKLIENWLKKFKPLVINFYLRLKIHASRLFKIKNYIIYLLVYLFNKKNHVSNSSIFFKKGDIYISMGLDWDKKDLNYLYSLKKNNKFKVHFFCYDIIPILFPHLCSGNISPIFIKYYIDLSHVSDKVFCISKNTENDLIKFWKNTGAPIKPTSVVRLGDTDVFTSDYKFRNPELNHFILQDFILMVSTIERRKNHEIIYRAYVRLIEKGFKNQLPNLIFVGMKGWGVNDFFDDLKFDLRVKDKIFIFDNISDVDLATLYKNCLFTVYPSLYEGWGLPVAESLSFGKFCLVSNSSSIPEIFSNKDCIDFIDPWDLSGWEKAILYYISNKKVLNKKEKMINKHFKPTAWGSTFEKVFK